MIVLHTPPTWLAYAFAIFAGVGLLAEFVRWYAARRGGFGR